MKVWEDARVIRGMRAQLETRRKRLERGDAPLGWKVGFAAPDMLKRLGISGPLVGFLTRNALVRSGATVSLAGWTKPVAEPEIAVHLGRDVAGGTDHAAAEAAIAGISPAIELADVSAPPRTPKQSSAPTFISATWCSPARLRRAPAPPRTDSCAASSGAAGSSPAPTIR